MAIVLLPKFLLRAPLLPARTPDPAATLRAHPLGAQAIALGSPDLAAALDGSPSEQTRAAPAFDRYARRACFRATPAGFLAGVGVGYLGAKTRLETGPLAPHLTPTWARAAAFGRAVLDDPRLRAWVRLRQAPSLVMRGSTLWWLGHDAAGDEPKPATAPLDAALAAVLDAAQTWTLWSQVRTALARVEGAADADALDELLLTLVDEGLLHHDWLPPLIGPPAWAWLRARLDSLPAELARGWMSEFTALDDACNAAQVNNARRALGRLPGAGARPDLQGVLHHQPVRAALSRRALQRAADVAPFLFRLQQALAYPVWERDLDQGLASQLAGVTEIFGAGAYDVGELLCGHFGGRVDETGGLQRPAPPPQPWLAPLVQSVIAAVSGENLDPGRKRSGELIPELVLDRAQWESLLPAVRVPASFEIIVTPAREPARAAPGTGWLLGLHGPAGSSWGRFAHAVPEAAAMMRATTVAPDPVRMDVGFAPSPGLADLTAHPPVAARALALSTWPEGETIRLQDLELVLEPSAAEPIGLRHRTLGPCTPVPAHRIRSGQAPSGLLQLICGWSLLRQHAPWAFTWGPLADLPALPRVRVDGFVVAPASFRVPDPATVSDARSWARWRRRHRVPRFVQAGHEDELLRIDLDDRLAFAALRLAPSDRLWEIWPPDELLPDQGGRRVEAVVAAVCTAEPNEPDQANAAHLADPADLANLADLAGLSDLAPTTHTRVARALKVPSPREQPPDPLWQTFKLFGLPDHQDAILVHVVQPFVVEERAQGRLGAWFFLRYADGNGHRHHLRLRLLGTTRVAALGFARGLGPGLAAAMREGLVVACETASYFPESARYGGPAVMPTVHSVFEADSELALAVFDGFGEAPDDDARIDVLVRAWDGLARGLNLTLDQRLDWALRLRTLHEADDEFLAEAAGRAYRDRPELAAALGAARDRLARPLVDHRTAVESAVQLLAASERARLVAALPPLLHMTANRLLAEDRAAEGLAYGLWHRALMSLRARSAGLRQSRRRQEDSKDKKGSP